MADTHPDTTQLVADLRAAVGHEHVLTDPDLRASYETDWTRRWHGHTPAVVRPEHGGQISEVLGICATHGVALVPQGGNTGLVGGSIPHHGEVLLSLARMDEVQVHPHLGTVDVGAGATLAAVHRAAAKAGWGIGIDLAARDSATIGGMIATNAGGIHAVRYGSMRQQVVGLQAVLADGSQIRPRMHGMPKDNGGYDLAELLIGSEGTLGIITGATLRMVPLAVHRMTALIGLDSVDQAVALLPRLRALRSLEAVELMFDRGVHLVSIHAGLPLPFDPLPPVLLLVECADATDPADELGPVLAGFAQVAVAVERADRWKLWAYRERHTEAISALGMPLKFDVGVRLQDFAEFVRDLEDDLTGNWPESIVILFGHLADGNVHVNVLPPEDMGTFRTELVEELVLRRVLDYEGAISAEHGIGVAKREWLRRARHRAELAPMYTIKNALDPQGLLNPNVLLP